MTSTRRVVEDKSNGFDHVQDSQQDFETSGDVKVISTFDDLSLKEDLLRGIYAYSEFARLVGFCWVFIMCAAPSAITTSPPPVLTM